MNKIADIVSEWISQSGDMTAWSWVITVIYAVTIILSIFLVNRLRREEETEKRFLWICILFFLLLMGINKQLDFQVLLTIIGRSLSRHQGWFEHRREIQKFFTIGIVVCLFPAVCLICYKIRTILRRSLLELSGVAILVFFAIVRAGSATHINPAIVFEDTKAPRIHGIELLGLLVILFALINHGRKRSRKYIRTGDTSS